MEIETSKKRYAVIGYPIEHSLSPLLHNKVFEKLKIDSIYEAVSVQKDTLKQFIESNERYLGLNVTIPHKESIIPLLSEISGDAAICGAVNTVVINEDKTVGLNTDMQGLLSALERCGYRYNNSVVSVFGTGGAALGATCKAASEGAKEVRIFGRNSEKASVLVERANEAAADNSVKSEIFYAGNLSKEALTGTDIFINATPLGMSTVADDFESFDFLDGLNKNAIVYDMVYRPAETNLIREAGRRSLITENGLSMLIYQAFLSDCYFTGLPLEEITSGGMYEYVYDCLEKELY